MALPRVPVSLVYIVTGLLPLLLLPTVLRNREKPGGTGVLLIVVGGSLWGLAFGTGFLLRGAVVGFVAANVVLLGASVSALGWVLATAEYSGVFTPTRGVLAVFLAEPLVMQVLGWTNSYHYLVYDRGTDFYATANLVSIYGPAFWVHTAFAYVLISGGILLMLGEVLSTHDVRRRQSLVLLAGGFPPVVANVWFILVPSRIDPTPFGFAAMSFILAWALFRGQFLDLVPIGRDQAISEMDDVVVTLDAEDRVIDCNPAARRLFEAGRDYAGTPGREFFADVPGLVDAYRDPETADTEISIDRNKTTRHFDLEISPLSGPTGDEAGRLVVLRDISLLKEREEALRDREAELDLLRQVLTRVLRHNIRNDLSVVQGYGEVLADELDGEHGELASTIVDTTDDLVQTSAKARTIEQLVDEEQTIQELDLVTMVEEVVASVESVRPGANITVETPDTCRVETTRSLELAVENLVENAVEHAGDDPAVVVRIDCRENETVLTVADDGPGIPDHELATLDAGEETPLQHGSGIGLWVVQWVIDNSNATITYETGSDGTEIVIHVPRG